MEMDAIRLKIIPHYTGDETLEQAVRNLKSRSLLWLEILLNEQIPWEEYLDRPEVKAAYEKACAWHSRFKTMIEGHTGRRPLRTGEGVIDMKEYRKFLEALHFAASRS